MREFNLKLPKYYKTVMLGYIVLLLFFIAWIIYIHYYEIDVHRYVVYGAVISSLVCLIKAMRRDRMLVLSEQYHQFLEDQHYIEHSIHSNQEISKSMVQLYERYDEWIQENWKILNKL